MLSDVVAVAEHDTAAEGEHVVQKKVSGQNEEEGGEATSSGSMKSPVTPAAMCEANGTPALRWKSYTAKQKECDAPEKASGTSTAPADSKGKLVINLCGSSRSSMKVSPTASEVKAPTGSAKKPEVCESSQEHVQQHSEDDDSPSSRSPIDIVTTKSLPSGSSKSVQDQVEELCTFKRPNVANDLAKIVCRRIRMVRHTLKTSQKPKLGRLRLRSHPKEGEYSQLNCAGMGSNMNSEGVEEAANIVDKEMSVRRRLSEGGLMNAAVEEQEDATGSEEVIYSEDEERFVDRNSDGKASAGVRSNGPAEFCEDRMEVLMKDVSNAGVAVKEVVSADPQCSQHMLVTANDIGCSTRDVGAKDVSYGRGRARSLSHDPGAFSETSKLDMKEQTVLETLLRDEPMGYSSGGGSEPSRSHRVERSGCEDYHEKIGHEESDQSGDSESTDAESDCSQSDGYDEGNSASSESHECDDEDCNCNALPPSMLVSPRKGMVCMEQVPSVLCDAEGNVWHIGKRAEQARGKLSLKQLRSSSRSQEKTSSVANKVRSEVLQELGSLTKMSGQRVTPYFQQIELNWKWPTDADYTISSVGDVSNRSMVYKERAVFVGCIPDGTENLEEILQNLMEKFLERFDFAPAILSQIQLVKVVKDFAFLELATEKVAHIALAANQLDVFEWGVNGFHFNIEGCKGTHTSVRPLIEYMPLKPARVIFVGNIPKSRWQKDYLEAFFTRILKGGDGPDECNLVNCVFLLPESCDAYVELASEVMADAIIFKCTKNPNILKEIGEDVFICRDSSSVPLMSKHKGKVCPLRSLYVGVSAPGQEFKIDLVRKVFEEILPMISRATNQPGYLEFISVQPGKDYAFFQFNSESIVDAVMEEYIVNTRLFVCNSSPLSYIILRPPGYERPGARYRSDRNRNGGFGMVKSSVKKFSRYENRAGLASSSPLEFMNMKQLGMVPLLPRRFGDEPAKKSDCIMSIGASPLPIATWNGLSSAGACAADPECMLIIEGLPKGLSYKLVRGALNELFEKSLSKSGLLEVGMLVLRYLDRDSNLDVVASLPSAKFVRALLSLRKTLIVAGTEIKLLPKGGKMRVTWKGKVAENGRGQGEVSCLSDDEVYQGERPKSRLVNVTTSIQNFGRRKRALSQIVGRVQGRKNPLSRRNEVEWDQEMGYGESLRSVPPLFNKDCKGDIRGMLKVSKGPLKFLSRRQVGSPAVKPTTIEPRREKVFNGMMSHVQNITGPLKFGKRDTTAVCGGRTSAEEFPSEILHIVSEGGKRKIQSVGTAPKLVSDLGKVNVLRMVGKKRKLLHVSENVAQKAVYMQRSFKKLRRVPHVVVQ